MSRRNNRNNRVTAPVQRPAPTPASAEEKTEVVEAKAEEKQEEVTEAPREEVVSEETEQTETPTENDADGPQQEETQEETASEEETSDESEKQDSETNDETQWEEEKPADEQEQVKEQAPAAPAPVTEEVVAEEADAEDESGEVTESDNPLLDEFHALTEAFIEANCKIGNTPEDHKASAAATLQLVRFIIKFPKIDILNAFVVFIKEHKDGACSGTNFLKGSTQLNRSDEQKVGFLYTMFYGLATGRAARLEGSNITQVLGKQEFVMYYNKRLAAQNARR